jgi:hypothetical protein
VHAHSLYYSYHDVKKLWCTLQLRGQIHSSISSLPLYVLCGAPEFTRSPIYYCSSSPNGVANLKDISVYQNAIAVLEVFLTG